MATAREDRQECGQRLTLADFRRATEAGGRRAISSVLRTYHAEEAPASLQRAVKAAGLGRHISCDRLGDIAKQLKHFFLLVYRGFEARAALVQLETRNQLDYLLATLERERVQAEQYMRSDIGRLLSVFICGIEALEFAQLENIGFMTRAKERMVAILLQLNSAVLDHLIVPDEFYLRTQFEGLFDSVSDLLYDPFYIKAEDGKTELSRQPDEPKQEEDRLSHRSSLPLSHRDLHIPRDRSLRSSLDHKAEQRDHKALPLLTKVVFVNTSNSHKKGTDPRVHKLDLFPHGVDSFAGSPRKGTPNRDADDRCLNKRSYSPESREMLSSVRKKIIFQ